MPARFHRRVGRAGGCRFVSFCDRGRRIANRLNLVHLAKRPGYLAGPYNWQAASATIGFGMSTTATPRTEESRGEKPSSRNFIQQIIDADRAAGKHGGRVHTRFPPEPNGYLHIGHAKSICLNFGLAQEYGGKFNLRFDDTNPTKEEQEYVDSIIDDVRWLGGDWEDRLFYASDYFQQLYDWAIQLIKEGKAYVCDLSAEEVRAHRGTLSEPGKNSPYRDRSVEENLDLFQRMEKGEFPDGTRTLRAKIDMASPNINMRDPVMYRIKHATHHRSGDRWCIYPSYDYTHGQSDSIEGITHSICTLEFENHRPLYDWFCKALRIHHPQQIEFARLNLTYTVMSKRKLLQLVQEKHVAGWDDPRMLTIRGLRRRGYTPEAIRAFCERIGVAKFNSTIDMAWLEDAIREDLNERAPRVMAVLRPLKVVITNYPEGEVEQLEAANHPQTAGNGHAQRAVLARAVHRGRRLHGRCAQKILPPRARPRSAAALCLLHHMHRSGEGQGRQHHRAALHVRPGHARRQRTRRPQSEGHDPLGLRTACRQCRTAALRSPVQNGVSRRSARGQNVSRQHQPRLARNRSRRQARTVARRRAARPALPIRAAGLLLHGPGRFKTRPPCLQSHGHAPRHVGQRSGEGIEHSSGEPTDVSLCRLLVTFDAEMR